MSFMSEASMDFQPATEEPSNMKPSSRKSSSTSSAITVTCGNLPRVSVKRMSTYSTSSSLMVLSRSLALMSGIPSFTLCQCRWVLQRVRAGFAGADADGLFDGADENLAVADFVGFGGVDDRFDGLIDLVVVDHHVDFHLGQEVDDIFGAAIKFGMAFLTAEALDLDDREALNTGVLQGFFDFVQFERLDDRFDLFHRAGLLATLVLSCFRALLRGWLNRIGFVDGGCRTGRINDA